MGEVVSLVFTFFLESKGFGSNSLEKVIFIPIVEPFGENTSCLLWLKIFSQAGAFWYDFSQLVRGVHNRPGMAYDIARRTFQTTDILPLRIAISAFILSTCFVVSWCNMGRPTRIPLWRTRANIGQHRSRYLRTNWLLHLIDPGRVTC